MANANSTVAKRTNPMASKAGIRIQAQGYKGGAELARSYFASLLADPESVDLGLRLDDVVTHSATDKHASSKDPDDQGALMGFGDTLQALLVTALSESKTEAVAERLREIGGTLYSIRSGTLQIIMGDEDPNFTAAGLQALSEKAGYLADQCLKLLTGEGGVCGAFEEWRTAVQATAEGGAS